MAAKGESTPLLGEISKSIPEPEPGFRQSLYDFLEAKTPLGRCYEMFVILLIVANVIAFILGSLFVEAYNPAPWAARGALCGNACDALLFGNYADNGLPPSLGTTSVLEVFTIAIFSLEYVLRFLTAHLEDARYAGAGRIWWVGSFFSVVDLAATVPFYVDVAMAGAMPGSAFLRMFRLLRMMRTEGRYESALSMVDEVVAAQRGIMGTALFVGATTWMTVSSLYYLAERTSLKMIYCGEAPECWEVDTDLCVIDEWGTTNCTAAGCPPSEYNPEPCYNLYQSIPMASYFTLLNLFGEFPLVDQHSVAGMVVGTLTAVVAVMVFAMPTSIVGNGFENEIEKRNLKKDEDAPIVEEGYLTKGFVAETNLRGMLYNFLHGEQGPHARWGHLLIDALVVFTTLIFMVETLQSFPNEYTKLLNIIEIHAVFLFTLEYLLKVYCCREDPKYQESMRGLGEYVVCFFPMVHLLSILPYWLHLAWTGDVFLMGDLRSSGAFLVKALLLLRILRFEKYTHAFTTFDDVFYRSKDVLTVTAFTAVLIWVLFSAFLYLTERDNPDEEMASYYNNVPNAMWITLLNLSGEVPLCQYSLPGKFAVGFLGIIATGIFGIPIGILGGGFEAVVEEENADDETELENIQEVHSPLLGTPLERRVFKLMEGAAIETCSFFLIFMAIAIGILQTVHGHEDDLSLLETLTVYFFTLEYMLRLLGAGADPRFAKGRNACTSRLAYLFSFYSVVDLLAIVPYYLTLALPGSVVEEYNDYLRMCRIIRLVKLDRYVPSISLIDDVIRLKWEPLKVTSYAAVTLLIMFTALLYVFESKDDANEIDPVPLYGCNEDCTEMDRFQNFFSSMVYTGIHLTGDYPIIEYSWPSRFVNFFMVIAAVGVVSIPSALIASGFVQLVQSKVKARRARSPEQPVPTGGVAGDDWYEYSYRALEGVPPPNSEWYIVDRLQVAVNEFLNGREEDGETKYSPVAHAARCLFFFVIVGNIAAVLAESVPSVDRAVGNEPGNFFDVFEAVSVTVFAGQYALQLFCAHKNRRALYSPAVYAITFFGIVDFLSTAPWFVQRALVGFGVLGGDDDSTRVFRVLRIVRMLQLEDFVVAFSKLDNVFRASKDVLKATGLMAVIIWVGCGALFFIFEVNNPNWRDCDDSVPLESYRVDGTLVPGCFDFSSTEECNEYYPGLCHQSIFQNMPNSLFMTAVFLGGEWGVVDFTAAGKLVCSFLCVCGIGLYAIPVGALFDSFGAILGLD